MLFLSHANESNDNEFTRWLALRLAGLGYPVWCDQTQLLGGEKFWTDIESAIRSKTTKFLVVLSRGSNDRESVLKELTVANRVAKQKGLTDFIIPLRIDDLPNDETTIELSLTGVIDFNVGWAQSLAKLVKKLERDVVPKDARFNPTAVAEWWRGHERQIAEVSNEEEICPSNWFRISDLPERIYWHSLAHPLKADGPRKLRIGVPNYRELGGLFSFEGKSGMARRLEADGKELVESQSMNLWEFQKFGQQGLRLGKAEARNIVISLLRQAWEEHCLAKGLIEYEMSGGQNCYWFPIGLTEGDKVFYQATTPRPSGRIPFRRMVARSIGRDGNPKKRLWHFATQAKLVRWPCLAFAIRSHVVFTEDGTLLPVTKQHSARRSACKQWYNNDWLDRMLAAMAFLHDPDYNGFISVPCGNEVSFTVSTRPLCFKSPISFGLKSAVAEAEIETDDDDDEPDIDEEDDVDPEYEEEEDEA